MATKHKIVWSNSARSNVKKIVRYIAADNQIAAQQLYEKMQEAAAQLAQFPHLGKKATELEKIGFFDVKEIVVSHWKIFYLVIDATVQIIAIVGSRRNIKEALKKQPIVVN